MKAFSYERARTVDEAIELVSGHPDAQYLAGGTNLVDHLRLGVRRPNLLVDVNGLGLDRMESSETGLNIGAGVRNSDLAADLIVRRDYPGLSQALLAGASGQLRNMATVGGNLLQRTRCLYFQDVTKPCNKREPGTGCPAREGISRDLGVLGTSHACIATHPSDMAVALAALDAVVVVRGPKGERRLALTEFYRLPGDLPQYDTNLDPADLIVAVELPAASPLTRSSRYRKARDRASYAFALGSVATAVQTDGDKIADVRLAFGAVAPRPWRATIAEQRLRGAVPSVEQLVEAVDAELIQAQPLPDNGFKIPLVRRLAVAQLSAQLNLPSHDVSSEAS